MDRETALETVIEALGRYYTNLYIAYNEEDEIHNKKRIMMECADAVKYVKENLK